MNPEQNFSSETETLEKQVEKRSDFISAQIPLQLDTAHLSLPDSANKMSRGQAALEAQTLRLDPEKLPPRVREEYVEMVLGDEIPHDNLNAYRTIATRVASTLETTLEETRDQRIDLPPYDLEHATPSPEDEVFDVTFYKDVNNFLTETLKDERFEIRVASLRNSGLQILFKGHNDKTKQHYEHWVKVGDMSPFGLDTSTTSGSKYSHLQGRTLSFFHPFREDMEAMLGLQQYMRKPQSIARLLLQATNEALKAKGLHLKSSPNKSHSYISSSAQIMWEGLVRQGLADSEELPNGVRRYWML